MLLPGEVGPVVFWRLDDERYATTWDSGEGARRAGGRWSPAGLPVVYCSLDPSTAILEVAVHKGFDTLNRVPHVLTSAAFVVPWEEIHVIRPADVPNRLWLYPTALSAAQQAFGAEALLVRPIVAIPSAVSRQSWNVFFDARRATAMYALEQQVPLDLDPRLNPPQRKG